MLPRRSKGGQNCGFECLPGIGERLGGSDDVVDEHGGLADDDCRDQRLLRREVPVERLSAEARPPRHIAHRQTTEAVGRSGLDGSVEQLGADVGRRVGHELQNNNKCNSVNQKSGPAAVERERRGAGRPDACTLSAVVADPIAEQPRRRVGPALAALLAAASLFISSCVGATDAEVAVGAAAKPVKGHAPSSADPSARSLAAGPIPACVAALPLEAKAGQLLMVMVDHPKAATPW